MANDILPERQEKSAESQFGGRADLPGHKGEFARIYRKKPETSRETLADKAKAKLAAAKIRDELKMFESEESGVDTSETEEQPTLAPLLTEKQPSTGIKGWWQKMFGGSNNE